MSIFKFLAIGFIFVATCIAWAILGATLSNRTESRGNDFKDAISSGWGPQLEQQHPRAYHQSPTAPDGRKALAPTASNVSVALRSDPRQRGLLRYRTYEVDFIGNYTITNSTPVTQTIYVEFQLPDPHTSYNNFSFRLGDGNPSHKTPHNGTLAEAVVLPAGGQIPLEVTYQARGVDQWRYHFGSENRVRDFALTMDTDFTEIDFPEGTGSPTEERIRTDNGWNLQWTYPDVLSASSIGMAMPRVLNAGPVVSRIAFYAPISLLFYFSVLLIIGLLREINLHPMNYFFIAAGYFSFHLLLAYLVDVLPLHASFAIAAIVSLLLICGYIHIATKGRLTKIAAIAQFAYMILFSYSFFFHGITGLIISIGAIATLALLMILSAKVDWAQKFTKSTKWTDRKSVTHIPPSQETTA